MIFFVSKPDIIHVYIRIEIIYNISIETKYIIFTHYSNTIYWSTLKYRVEPFASHKKKTIS